MGVSVPLDWISSIVMSAFKSVLFLAAIIACAAADWSGNGKFSCYGHAEVEADFGEGANNAGEGKVRCIPVEWDSATGLGPEAIFFENASTNFEIWAWDYHPSWGFGDVMPVGTCSGQLWYKAEDMGAGFCTPNKNWNGCGIVQCFGDVFIENFYDDYNYFY